MLRSFLLSTTSTANKQVVPVIKRNCSGFTNWNHLQFIPKTVTPAITCRLFGTTSDENKSVKRDIQGFQPCLNNFIAQYALTSNKEIILDKLGKNSEKYGFSVLSKAVNSFLMESNSTNQINLYSMIIIATIQVKDDSLLSYVLKDMDYYIQNDSHVVYEVLKRICHYRKYTQFITFLKDYYTNHPDALEDKSLCEMGLYLISHDNQDNRELASLLWNQLQKIPVSTDEEILQRKHDLSNYLSSLIQFNDWTACSVILHDAVCDISHITQLLRGMAISPMSNPNNLISTYLDYHDIIYKEVNDQSLKDILFITDLMLDVFKLNKDENILNMVVNDLINLPSICLSEHVYSHLCNLCLHYHCNKLIYQLYCYNEGNYTSLIPLYRRMERYLLHVEDDSEKIKEIKDKVFALHYSNSIDEKMEGNDNEEMVFDEDEFIEDDVLQILQSDFNIKKVSKDYSKRKMNQREKNFDKTDKANKNKKGREFDKRKKSNENRKDKGFDRNDKKKRYHDKF